MEKRSKNSEQLPIDQHLISAVLNGTVDPLFVKDLDRRYVLINSAGALWIEKEVADIIGKSDEELIPEDLAKMIADHDKKVFTTGETITYEGTLHVGDKKRKYLATESPYRDEKGNIIGLIGVARDITEIRQMEMAKDNFLAMLSHELRNPLAPIHNAVEIIKLQSFTDEHAKNLFSVIERQVKNMTRLLDDLLDASRLTRGKIVLQKEQIDLASIVLRSVETARPFMESRKHAFSISLPPESVPFCADSVRLEQILVNLLNNATKFTDRGGKISLSAAREGNIVVFRVKDSGKGIAPDMLGRIFDLFFQEDQSLVRAERGLGVGLTIVRTLVEMHGGEVEVRSAGIDKGTEFIVRLPIIDETPPVVAPLYDSPAKSENGYNGKKKILVVDDNRDAATSLGELLKRWGYEVRTVNDGPTVLKEVPQWQPNVVLLDIGLPEMDGYEVAQELKRQDSCPMPLIVAVTGYGQEEDKRRAQEVGFDYYFTKPIDFGALRQILMA